MALNRCLAVDNFPNLVFRALPFFFKFRNKLKKHIITANVWFLQLKNLIERKNEKKEKKKHCAGHVI